LGVVTALIANSKGRDPIGWGLYGALLFIVALPHILIISPNRERMEQDQLASGGSKKCPFCAEIIKAEASVCRFCGRSLYSAADTSDDAVTRRLVEALERAKGKQL
jgi:hypothetical protein